MSTVLASVWLGILMSSAGLSSTEKQVPSVLIIGVNALFTVLAVSFLIKARREGANTTEGPGSNANTQDDAQHGDSGRESEEASVQIEMTVTSGTPITDQHKTRHRSSASSLSTTSAASLQWTMTKRGMDAEALSAISDS